LYTYTSKDNFAIDIKIKSNQSKLVLLKGDQKLTSFSPRPTYAKQKEIMEKLKQKTIGHYRDREGSPVDVRWAVVRWVAEDLWWERLLEKVCIQFRVEESGSDGWRE